jgi:7-cyano-7-deazaguanine synthase
MNKPAIILLSGGLDSTTCAAIAKKDGYDLHGLTINYGQKHNYELKAAKLVAQNFKFNSHAVIDIDLASFGGSSLVSEEIEVPKNRNLKIKDDIPSTYVPARNTVFLSIALAKAETINAFDIFIGVNAIDYSGYPDCRPEFILQFEKMMNVATKDAAQNIGEYKIHTPLIKLTKAEIIKKGQQLGIDYQITSSCYSPNKYGQPCGQCDACKLRIKGFYDAGLADPLNYE